jgi:hypothetical protein
MTTIRISNIVSSKRLQYGNLEIEYDNNAKFMGQVNELGSFDGVGHYEDELGNYYTGGFKNGKKHGKCVEKSWDITFLGEYNENGRVGSGKETYKDDEYSVGNYVDNKRHGNFVFTKPNGDQVTRTYVNGNLFEKGIMVSVGNMV